jgi:hypothetical protein
VQPRDLRRGGFGLDIRAILMTAAKPMRLISAMDSGVVAPAHATVVSTRAKLVMPVTVPRVT